MWRISIMELEISDKNVAISILLSVIWKILYMRQDNVAGFDFWEHKDALLPKMWQIHVADTRGRYTWQTRVADMQSKTSDTIAAPVKDDFPLTLLQLL